jgi:hypothetical protein
MRRQAGIGTGRQQTHLGQLHSGGTDAAEAAIAAWRRRLAAATTAQLQPHPASLLTVERRLHSAALHHTAALQPSLQPTPPAALVPTAHGCCVAADGR